MTDPELELIEVRFDGNTWWVEDEALRKPLKFSRLADAEARAADLSMETGRRVRVQGWDGDVIDTFVYVQQDPSTSGYFDDISARFSLLELY